MSKLFIYYISAEPYYPVCDAGAVVIAHTPEEALSLCDALNQPCVPQLIGKADKKYKEPEIITINNGNY